MSLVPLTPDTKGQQKDRTKRPLNEADKASLRRQKEKSDFENRNGYTPK